ncbi:hypothetical protein Tco_1269956 [Tanacetum coccineum]
MIMASDLIVPSTFSGNETASFFSFLGAAAALVFSCMGAMYRTPKMGVGVASMGVMRADIDQLKCDMISCWMHVGFNELIPMEEIL